MKKKLLFLLLTSVFSLTSCIRWTHTAYNVYIDDEYHLRTVQYSKRDRAVSVDEYYYTSDVYSGHIEINITIPSEINGMRVFSLGRSRTTSIGEEPYIHDHGCVPPNDNEYNGFTIICYSYFEEGTTFDININCEGEVYEPFVFTLDRMFTKDHNVYTSPNEKEWVFLMYNNNENANEDASTNGIRQLFPCNLSITANGETQVLDYKYACITSNIWEKI